jgi:hypothetical protein
MSDDVTDWRELREFNAVDLAKSFVLSWNFESDSLLVDLDLCLCPEHAFYEKPRPSEKACYRPAILEYPKCSDIRYGADANRVSVMNAVENLGHGAIDHMRKIGEGHYEMTGEFGQVEVEAARPLLRLEGPIA